MKKISLSFAVVSILFTSCMGKYALFNSLDKWNKGVTENKFVNNVIFWVLNIIPVYSIAFGADILILNLIEFWTGSNPITLKPGEIKEKVVTIKGNSYKMTATKNAMKVLVLSGEEVGKTLDLSFNEASNNWLMTNENGKTINIANIKEGILHVQLPNKQVLLPLHMNVEVGLSLINNKLATVAIK